jgi:hypothetical protein
MVSVPPSTYVQLEADCTAGTTPISGGAWGNLFGTVAEVQTWPALGKVTVTIRNDSGITVSGQATAVCAAK